VVNKEVWSKWVCGCFMNNL